MNCMREELGKSGITDEEDIVRKTKAVMKAFAGKNEAENAKESVLLELGMVSKQGNEALKRLLVSQKEFVKVRLKSEPHPRVELCKAGKVLSCESSKMHSSLLLNGRLRHIRSELFPARHSRHAN